MRILLAAAAAMVAAMSAAPASAQLGARTTQEWLNTLENPTRVQGLKVAETVAALKLKPGDVVADVGTGSGIFVAPLAGAVGQTGRVYAQDVDKGLVDAVAKRAAEFRLRNVATVLGGFTDPGLPAQVDLAFINDVLHHVEDRPGFVMALSKSIKRGGRVALIDFIPGMGGHPDQPAMQIPKAQANAWMAAAGLQPVEDLNLFTDKYFVIYAKR